MFADAASAPVFLRLLSRVEHCDRATTCAVAVGTGSLFRRGAAYPLASDNPNCNSVLFTEADAGCRCRPEPAEDDDVYAPDDGLLLLLCLFGACTILVNRKSSGNRSAAHY